MGRQVRILREADVRAALDLPSLVDAVEAAFVAYSAGRAELPGVIHLDVPERGGEIHVKAGHLHGASHYAVKVASGFPGNVELGRSPNDGLVLAFDAVTGAPAAFLLDNGAITDLRTAAAGGVAARHLAPQTVGTVAVIGTGTQARLQLDALACVRSFGEVRVWGRSPERATAFVEELASRPGLPDGILASRAGSVREAVEGAAVVLTCTASRTALVQAAWLGPGAHVTAVGSDGAGKQELASEVLERADVLVVDARPQSASIGELRHAIEAGLVREQDAVELGEVAVGARTGRTADEQLTVCDLTGVGVQDVAAAALVLERSGDRGERLGI